jgi:predicted RNA-binding Zn-ribbon protein involved in translation (DUF1610 family)
VTREPVQDPLRCQKCDAPVPLINATSFRCPYCRATVKVPAEYKALFETNALETRARHDLETRYAQVSCVPSHRFDAVAFALVLFGPAIAVATWISLAGVPGSANELFTAVIIPALLPGTALWMWSASLHATVVRYELALAAAAPATSGGLPCCRNCGAPLEAQADAIFARCAYCGTDSMVVQLVDARRRLDQALRAELATIEQAITALRYRRRLVIGGIAIASAVLAAFVGALQLFSRR